MNPTCLEKNVFSWINIFLPNFFHLGAVHKSNCAFLSKLYPSTNVTHYDDFAKKPYLSHVTYHIKKVLHQTLITEISSKNLFNQLLQVKFFLM